MPKSYRVGGGLCDFSVSPSPFGLDFGTLDFGTSDSGLTIPICSNLKGAQQMMISFHLTLNFRRVLIFLKISFSRLRAMARCGSSPLTGPTFRSQVCS